MNRGHRIEVLDVFEDGGVRVRYLDHPSEART